MIHFFGKDSCLKSKKRNIKSLISTIVKDHHKSIGSIDYIFVDDEALLKMNIDVLKHDYYTDIITFDYSDNDILEGEIYISIDRVKENAINFNQKFHVELLRVIIHGVLHMLGYKDKTQKQKPEMREREDFYINKYKELFHVEQHI